MAGVALSLWNLFKTKRGKWRKINKGAHDVYICRVKFSYFYTYHVRLSFSPLHFGYQKVSECKAEGSLFDSIPLSEQLRTDPSPNPTLTLTCYQLTVVGLREGLVCSFFDTGIDPILVYSQIIPQYERRITTKSRWSSCHFNNSVVWWSMHIYLFIYLFTF